MLTVLPSDLVEPPGSIEAFALPILESEAWEIRGMFPDPKM